MFDSLTTPKAGRAGIKRQDGILVVLAGIALVAAACSSAAASPTSTTVSTNATTSGSPTTSAPSTAAPTTAPPSTTAGASGGAGSVSISMGKAGSLGSVLTGPNGHTLYLLTTEHNGQIMCTGSCAQAWPPLTVPSGSMAKEGSGLSGAISTVTRPGGAIQASYDGHPLYYYSGDSAAGQASGQGVGGIWFAVTTAGKAASTSSVSKPTTTTTSGGYSY